ncbi:MAG: hypothetical protein U0989_18470, partial [Azonexus sp.]|nr:hypothetical protein [Azonexus sp.]
MSKLTKFLGKFFGQGAVNAAAGEAIGGAALGVGAALNNQNLGGYQSPNIIDGYSYNPADGKWYTPFLLTGEFDFSSPADSNRQADLDQQRYWRDLHNRVEGLYPQDGAADALNPPPIMDMLQNLPEIYGRYREIWPDIYQDLREYFFPNGVPNFGENFNRAKTWTWPRDPIILDLDGDGLETVGLASNIHFDHDGDGVLTKTGWVGKDDALLVWDRNANGSIDTGAELFGDFTMLPNGTLAPNGFAALAAL